MTDFSKEPIQRKKDKYDSLIETLEIQSNKYLVDKINRGRKQASEGKVFKHKLIDPDDEVSKK